VIPAYNEAGRIHASLERLTAWLQAPGRTPAGPAEILVIDDGSADATAALVIEAARALPPGAPSLRLLQNGVNRGKGYSIKHGVLMATGTYVLLSDADFSTPIEQLPVLLEARDRHLQHRQQSLWLQACDDIGADAGLQRLLHRRLRHR